MEVNDRLEKLKSYLKQHNSIDLYFYGGINERIISFDSKLPSLKEDWVSDVLMSIENHLIFHYDIPKDSDGFYVEGNGVIKLEDDKLIIEVEYYTYDPENPEEVVIIYSEYMKKDLYNIYKNLLKFKERYMNCRYLMISLNDSSFKFDISEIRLHGVPYQISDILSQDDISSLYTYITNEFNVVEKKKGASVKFEISMNKKRDNLRAAMLIYNPVETHEKDKHEFLLK